MNGLKLNFNLGDSLKTCNDTETCLLYVRLYFNKYFIVAFVSTQLIQIVPNLPIESTLEDRRKLLKWRHVYTVIEELHKIDSTNTFC